MGSIEELDYEAMSVDKALKLGYKVLYDEKDAQQALKVYDSILQKVPNTIDALVYRAACLEKLYFGNKEDNIESVINDANESLSKALVIAQGRNESLKIAFVYFRLFIHYMNRKSYTQAENFLKLAKQYNYNDSTLDMWEKRLENKLKKQAKKVKDDPIVEKLKNVSFDPITEKPKPKSSFRIDWYQTPNNVTISLFTDNLPSSSEDVTISITDGQSLHISYPVVSKGSEFQYQTKLFKQIDPADIKCKVFTKKIEITFSKIEKKVTWHSLSIEATSEKQTDSNKKDWSSIDVDDEVDVDDNDGSTDAFFQKIYENADPDTQRAMMKSFVESNGTSLNTSWDDVKDKTVETVPPEGSELKHY